MPPADPYHDARKYVKAKRHFYQHLQVYMAVGAFFLALNLLTDPWDLWFFFPLLPWGAAVAIHYFTVFGMPGTGAGTEQWQEREYARELRRRGLAETATESEDTLDLPDLNKPAEAPQRPLFEDRDLV